MLESHFSVALRQEVLEPLILELQGSEPLLLCLEHLLVVHLSKLVLRWAYLGDARTNESIHPCLSQIGVLVSLRAVFMGRLGELSYLIGSWVRWQELHLLLRSRRVALVQVGGGIFLF